MIHSEIYASAVIKADELIANTIGDFSDLVIQLSMSGEFSDIDDLFDEGDEVILSVKDFLHSSDERVENLIKILNCLRNVQNSFSNNNG
ncbi:hypothetical protein [Pedobacter nototheniae]|uniref:hypothetical protein n=1 Tax=Pedobacter nototheniae TaxID=2488994 RepID=UPI00292EEA1B|nr:hypothetical protein [Pedobacter nototheniae]